MNTIEQYPEPKTDPKPRPRLDKHVERSTKLKELIGNIKDIIITIGAILSIFTPILTALWLFFSTYLSPHSGAILDRFNNIFGAKVIVAPAEDYFDAVYRTYPYIAQPGDQLNVLAMRHLMSLEQVLHINSKLKVNPDLILAYETEIRLRVQAEHIVAKGDSITNISKKYHIPINELLRANNRKESYLEVGETLKIPFFVDSFRKNSSMKRYRTGKK